jgi:meso-butanediol dehydrogenase/(S,S)-butanediol dehydrogenase/diacetyl reductase
MWNTMGIGFKSCSPPLSISYTRRLIARGRYRGAVSTPRRFEGRIALVTGAGSGIGRATAERLAAEGAAVACLDRDEAMLAEAVSAIEAASSEHRVLAAVCDVTNADAVEAAFVAAEEAWSSPPDVVCNIAGVGGFAHTHDTTEADWGRMIGVNLTGTFLVCRAALKRWQRAVDENPKLYRRRRPEPGMTPTPRPAIVNIASSAGLMGQPYSAAYCASKGGVVQLTRALAVEYLEVGFRVNAVAPGGVDTPLLGSFMPPEDSSDPLIARMVSPFGFAPPSDIASVVVFLASEECGPTTGAIVPVDGGLTC